MARIAYADREDLPPEKRALLDTLSNPTADEGATASDDGAGDHSLDGTELHVYRLLGRNVALLEGFRAYATTLWHESGLSPLERELVVLTTARTAGSPYIWQQHVRVALDEGVSRETILAVSSSEVANLEPAHAALVTYVERFVENGVDDESHELLAERYDERTVLGIGLLAGCYLGLAHLFAALEIDLEREFVGWDLESLA